MGGRPLLPNGDGDPSPGRMSLINPIPGAPGPALEGPAPELVLAIAGTADPGC